MIVFDLQCTAHAHVFEAWFASSTAFSDQQERGLLLCPICGDTDISKAVMAPAVGKKGNATSTLKPGFTEQTLPVAHRPVPPMPAEMPLPAEMKAMLAKMAQMQAAVIADSTWVGRNFAREARAMDAGETETTSIYGEVTPSEAQELIEDGIAVMPLLLPVVPPDQRN